jgi:hypothetical protein
MIHLFKLSANSLIHTSIHDEEKQDFYVPLYRLYTGMSHTSKKPPAAMHIFHSWACLRLRAARGGWDRAHPRSRTRPPLPRCLQWPAEDAWAWPRRARLPCSSSFPPSPLRPRFFFAIYTSRDANVQRTYTHHSIFFHELHKYRGKHLMRMHSHPYKYMYANSTLMNTSGTSSTTPLNPTINSEKYEHSTKSRT